MAQSDIEADLPPKSKSTPLPTTQLWIVLLVQGAEPVCGTVIYPFIARFVQETGITEGNNRRTGYYAGILESLFYIAEAATVVFWGRASDIFGRRPIIVFGMLGLTFATIGLGFSRTFWAAVVARCAQGVFNGNIGVARSAMGELLDSSNITEAFGLLPFIWAAGFTVGPLIGGSLSNIAERWPEAPELFKIFPYLLPCATASLATVALFIWSLTSLKETLPSLVKPEERIENGDLSENTTLLDHSITQEYGTNTNQPRKPPNPRMMLTLRVLIPILNHGIYASLDGAYNALLPLMFSSSLRLGGLGLSPMQIGLILGVWSFANMFVQSFAFSRMVKHLGLRRMYIVCFGSMWVIMVSFPLMSVLAKRSGGIDGWVCAVMLASFAARSLSYMTYPCLSIFIIESAPDPALLGTINGIAQMASSSMRAVGPSLASSLYSISLEKHLMGGQLVYFVMLVLCACGSAAGVLLPERR